MPLVQSISGSSSKGYGDLNALEYVTTGLQLHLDAGSKNSYPGSGTTWYDISGNGYTCTSVNSPTFVSNGYRSYFNFDGTSQYFSSTFVQPNYTTSTNYTLNVWVLAQNNIDPQIIGNRGTNSPTDFSKLTTNKFEYYPSASGSVFIGATMPLQSWNNYTIVFNSGTIYYYRNGQLTSGTVSGTVLTASAAFTVSTGTTLPFYICGDPVAQEYNSASVGMISTYNRSLSQTEIIQNYNIMAKRFNSASIPTSNRLIANSTGTNPAGSGYYNYAVFTSNGTFTVSQAGPADILVVGGGGGGGSGTYAGGGGVGSVIYNTNYNIPVGTYSVSIGNGGSAGSNGSSTSFGSLLTANGGLSGFSSGNGGASGGGNSGGTGGTNNYGGGGGGGSASSGSNGNYYQSVSMAGSGGFGYYRFGIMVGAGGGGSSANMGYYPVGSGGAGGTQGQGYGGYSSQAVGAGNANTGNGGGGGPTGASGGSGIVIVRWLV